MYYVAKKVFADDAKQYLQKVYNMNPSRVFANINTVEGAGIVAQYYPFSMLFIVSGTPKKEEIEQFEQTGVEFVLMKQEEFDKIIK